MSTAPAPEVPANVVVEALVREYLVKRGLTATLEAFNKEKPKHSGSITKREVLRKCLNLERAAARYKKETQSELPPTLELWVLHTMAKVNSFFDIPAAPVPPPKPKVVKHEEEEPEEVSMPEAPLMSTFGRRAGQGIAARPTAPPQSRPGPPRSIFNATAPAAPSMAGMGRKMAGMSISNGDGSDGEPEIVRASPPPGAPAGSRSATSASLSSAAAAGTRGPLMAGSGGSSGAAMFGSRPAATAAAAGLNGRAGLSATAPAPRHEMLMEDVGEDELGEDDGGGGGGGLQGLSLGLPASQGFGRPAGSGGGGSVAAAAALRNSGQPVPPDTMRALKALLWGGQGQPPPSWHQGFFFNRRPGLQFGLVQKQGGPCGVLAAVQAHILAALQCPEGFTTEPRPQQQQQALISAITEILWQARFGPSAYVVLPGGEAGLSARSLSYDALARSAVMHSASSKDKLQDLVSAALPSYMDEDGWGVVLLLWSLLLSRGHGAVRQDMDEPDNALMGMHGYCTQELVNLILTGQAISNVFDGTRQLDGSTTLQGINRRCRVGLLTLFEWYKYVEVGKALKNPDLPIWVVCSESHFTVLFSHDMRSIKGSLPFDLIFYDELANQDAPIRLTVRPDPKGGWTARMGDTIGDRGKCEGQNIPPLECVIETKWPGVSVDWNGSEPIL